MSKIQTILVSHFTDESKPKPLIIECYESDMLTGIFNVSKWGNVYHPGQRSPFAFVSKVFKNPENQNQLLVELGTFEK